MNINKLSLYQKFHCQYCKENIEKIMNDPWKHECFLQFSKDDNNLVYNSDKSVFAVANGSSGSDIKSIKNSEKLIEAVRKQICIWNSDIPVEERGPKQRIEAWEKVSKELDSKKKCTIIIIFLLIIQNTYLLIKIKNPLNI